LTNKTIIKNKTALKTKEKLIKIEGMTNKDITADYIGDLKIGGITVPCAVLSNEERVIFQREFVGMLTGNKKGGLERYLKAGNLLPYLPDKFKGESWDQGILRFQYNSSLAHGLKSADIIDILEMYLKARDAGALQKNQIHLAKKAEILMRAFAKVGLTALIDEATGFQYSRKHDALRILLEQYVVEEMQKWIKRFPDEFFNALDKLYKNEKTTPRSRPQYYGKFINTYIYNPIENGYVKSELNKKNILSDGKRKAKFHQWLTEFGINQLILQIGRVMGVIEISQNVKAFKTTIARQKSLTVQPELFLSDD
jgi:hypothetical protein